MRIDEKQNRRIRVGREGVWEGEPVGVDVESADGEHHSTTATMRATA